MKSPRPGSREALDAGCKCPVLDNAHGAGYMGVKGTYVYNSDCELHSGDKMTIKDHVLAQLALGPNTAGGIHKAWPGTSLPPNDWRSVNRVLKKLGDEGLVKASRRWGQATMWRLV